MSRLKPDGTYEYRYNNAAVDQYQTPRTANADVYVGAQSTGGSSAGPYQNSGTYYPDYPNNDHDATPRASFSLISSPTNTYHGTTVASSSRDYNAAPAWPSTNATGMTGSMSMRYINPSPYQLTTSRNQEYTYAPMNAAPSAVDSTAYSFGQMSLAPPQAQQVPASFYDPGLEYPVQRHISKGPDDANSEYLDPRYKTVSEREQDNFFRVGRVFMMLWTEPARDKVPAGGGSRNGSHFSTTYLQGTAYTEIRRFVVVWKQHGNSICCPIHTYSGEATLKRNLPDVQQHTIIYTTDFVPEPHSYTAQDGTIVTEQLTKLPIKVNSEESYPEAQLDPKSRLNYSKIYTVEHYVRVLNIGMVHQDSMPSLCYNCPFKRTEPSERPKPHPPRANHPKKHRKDSKKPTNQ